MHSKPDITDKVGKIIRSVISCEEKDERVLLHIILSNSFQAASLVTIIEDEFDIAFDDDDINLDFFKSIHRIVELIAQLLNKS